jgi:hypothetical protein
VLENLTVKTALPKDGSIPTMQLGM